LRLRRGEGEGEEEGDDECVLHAETFER
jgi:hypothetical protein